MQTFKIVDEIESTIKTRNPTMRKFQVKDSSNLISGEAAAAAAGGACGKQMRIGGGPHMK